MILLRPDAIRALEGKRAKVCLPRYREILLKGIPAKYLVCKSIEAEIKNGEEGWKEHEEKLKELREKLKVIKSVEELEEHSPSLLDLKIELCKELMKSCSLCERMCKVDRLKGEVGFCGVKEARIASEFLHYGEEAELVPSYTIFFAGCNFKCCYCQNWDISQYPMSGIAIDAREVAEMIERKKRVGARNVNWVGGEPTPNLLFILQVLKHCKANIPIVWNSNVYLTEKAMELLDGIVDIHLTDFKYGNNRCALRLSKVPRYFDVAKRNHLIASEQAELIIRQLVLPNHVDCCTKPIVEWIAKHLGTDVYLNIMPQYRPEYKAMEYKDIARYLEEREFREAIDYALKMGFPEFIIKGL